MALMPFQILVIWARGLLSIILLALGPYLLYQWYQRAHVDKFPTDVAATSTTQSVAQVATSATGSGEHYREFAPNWGFNGQTAFLIVGLAATLWALPKGPLNLTRLRLRHGTDE